MNKNLLAVSMHIAFLFGTVRAQDHKPSYEYLFSFRHDEIITSAAFSKDGRRLASGSEAGTVMVTEVASQKTTAIKNADSLDNGVQAVQFSRDGKLLLVGGFGNKKGGGEIRVLQTGDYKPLVSLDVPWDKAARLKMIRYLDISPDNKWLISADLDHVWIWNLQEKKVAWQVYLKDSAPVYDGGRHILLGVGEVGPAANLAVSPGMEKKPATTAVRPGQVVFFDILEGKVTRLLQAHDKGAVTRVLPAKDNKELFVLTDAGAVYRLDAETGKVKQRIPIKELCEKASKRPLRIWHNMGVEVLDTHGILVVNDREHTFFINIKSDKIVKLDHRSSVGIRFAASGKEFAILGGVKNKLLTGIPEQRDWTVNVFSFSPF